MRAPLVTAEGRIAIERSRAGLGQVGVDSEGLAGGAVDTASDLPVISDLHLHLHRLQLYSLRIYPFPAVQQHQHSLPSLAHISANALLLLLAHFKLAYKPKLACTKLARCTSISLSEPFLKTLTLQWPQPSLSFLHA